MKKCFVLLLPLALACSETPAPKTAPQATSKKQTAVALTDDDCVSAHDIQKALSARSMGFQDCYADALAVDPSLSGIVTLEVVVPPSGHVDRVRATSNSVNSPKVISCIEEVASGLEFIQVDCSLAQSVEYPVRLARGSSEFAGL